MKTYNALQRGSSWLKTKLSRRQRTSKKASPRGPEGRSLSIGPPTDFRREAITLGTDVDGNAMLVEQAREDAQKMHNASKEGVLRKHGRKISARFGGGGGQQQSQGDL